MTFYSGCYTIKISLLGGKPKIKLYLIKFDGSERNKTHSMMM